MGSESHLQLSNKEGERQKWIGRRSLLRSVEVVYGAVVVVKLSTVDNRIKEQKGFGLRDEEFDSEERMMSPTGE